MQEVNKGKVVFDGHTPEGTRKWRLSKTTKNIIKPGEMPPEPDSPTDYELERQEDTLGRNNLKVERGNPGNYNADKSLPKGDRD